MEISLHKEEIFSGRILKLERHLVKLIDDSEASREVVR
ncbi:MAG: ADP-ribose pyrophosphatase, partial [Thermotogaceae bacterium]|nr:ADP-ribose pyrophosphatase [Thermotogaceae bacterium]